MPLNEPNSLSIQFNWLNLCGIFSIHGNALCSCAEQMPMFPAASLIMTGIVVIELLSHCCACAELHSLTGAFFCQRALGRRVAVDGKRPSNHSSPSKSTNYTLLNHLWSPLFSPQKKKLHRNKSYPLGCTFFFNFFSKLNLATAASRKDLDKDVILGICAPLSLVSLEQVPVNESPLLCARTNFEGK